MGILYPMCTMMTISTEQCLVKSRGESSSLTRADFECYALPLITYIICILLSNFMTSEVAKHSILVEDDVCCNLLWTRYRLSVSTALQQIVLFTAHARMYTGIHVYMYTCIREERKISWYYK